MQQNSREIHYIFEITKQATHDIVQVQQKTNKVCHQSGRTKLEKENEDNDRMYVSL